MSNSYYFMQYFITSPAVQVRHFNLSLFLCLEGYDGEVGPLGDRGQKGTKVRCSFSHTNIPLM